jgi:hypothetical protein
MIYECDFANAAGARRTVIVGVPPEEIAVAEQTPGSADELLSGFALRTARQCAPLGFASILPVKARELRWSGSMKFEVALVNPKTSEDRTIIVELAADQVEQARESGDQAGWIQTFAKPKFPPDFMAVCNGVCPVRPKLWFAK